MQEEESLFADDEVEFVETDVKQAKDDTEELLVIAPLSKVKSNKSKNEFRHLRERKWRYLFYNIGAD